jgi:hypothetical protein
LRFSLGRTVVLRQTKPLRRQHGIVAEVVKGMFLLLAIEYRGTLKAVLNEYRNAY